MKNLMTRKIVLGLLMTLVLAFSVQGTADAGVTFSKSRSTSTSGDYQTQVENRRLSSPFTFSVSQVDAEAKDIKDTDPDTPSDQAGTEGPDSISIGISPGSIYRIVIGSTEVYDNPAGAASVTLSAASETNNLKLIAGSVKVYCALGDAGVYTLTVDDTSTDNDEDDEADDITFKAYAVQSRVDVEQSVNAVAFDPANAAILYDTGDEIVTVNLTGSANSFAEVYLEISGGSLYVPEPYDTGTDSFSFTTRTVSRYTTHTRTGGNATVQFRPNRGSNVQITARVVFDSDLEAVKTYYYNNAVLAKVSGDEQVGRPNTQLVNPLVVKVENGSRRAVPGQVVLFQFSDATSDFSFSTPDADRRKTGRFRSVLGTTVLQGTEFVDAEDHASIDTNQETLSVVSDSRGEAKVYVVLTNAEAVLTATNTQYYEPTATILRGLATNSGFGHRAATQKFRATADPSPTRDSRDIRIVSGDNQNIAVRKNADPLVVVVESDGNIVEGVSVTFSANGGELSFDDEDNFGNVDTDNDDDIDEDSPGSNVRVDTDASGRASVNYYVGSSSGVRKIDAIILIDPDEIPTTSETFTINVGGAREVRDDEEDEDTEEEEEEEEEETLGTITAAPPSLDGEPGEVVTLNVAAGTATVNVFGSSTFTSAGGTVTAVGNILSVRLPNRAGTYSLTLRADGYNDRSVAVEVTDATPGTLSITRVGSPVNGQQIVEVTSRAPDGTATSGSLTVTLTGPGISRTVETLNGSVRAAITLPTAAGTHTLTVSAEGYTSGTVLVTGGGGTTVRGTGAAASLERTSGNNQTGSPGARLASPFVVTVLDSNDRVVTGQLVRFSVTAGGGSLSAASDVTDSSGRASTTLTLGSTGRNTVRASVVGITSVTFTATVSGGEPELLTIVSGNNQRGILNEELDDPLVVQVSDEDDEGVADVRVTFRRTSGDGRISDSRTGNAIAVRTDRRGTAQVDFTPTGAGPITVRASVSGLDPVEFTITTGPPPASIAKVSGDNQAGTPGSALANAFVVEVQDAEGDAVSGVTVAFEVTAGGGSISDATATTNASGRAQTTLTLGSERGINSVRASVAGLDPVTFNTSVEPVVHIAAANRPVMYWIDGGALYRLASAKAEKIAESANDIAVDTTGGKIYWTEETSSNIGKIHSANLDGSGAQVLKELMSLPYGIALDSANSKLYLTNSRSKIRRMNVDGTEFEANFIQGLDSPTHLAVSSGNVYWIEDGDSVRFANVAGTKVVRDIVTGSNAIGGIAIGGSKVYWTEQTGETTGSIRSANLGGTGVANVITLNAVPRGIAVDVADGKIFWTDDQGRIQRIRIDNQKRADAVSGLMAPSALALGVENAAEATPTATTTTTRSTTTAAASKYDVNGDGTVDNADVGIVVGALLAGTNPANLDVNGDGQVDITDVVEVSKNVDASGAAAAPTLRARLTSVQVDRIQEQIDLLLTMDSSSIGVQRALAHFQNLLAVARPAETQLLANYPNPFNPETWIPYELATDTNVQITIYDAHGVVVRTLSFGHQPAGYYTGRDRAAYWDGRNSLGESVASGLYFYQLETDKTSSMRKMVILK